jgi:hypothetical protein
MARGRKNKPEIDICRVRTDRLRDMNGKQLEKVAYRVGRLFEIPKKQVGETKPRWLLAKFIADLRASRSKNISQMATIDPAPWEKKHRSMEDTHEAKMAVFYREEADRVERKIWDMQQKRGCNLPAREHAARDAAREGRSSEFVDLVRGKRRPKIH